MAASVAQVRFVQFEFGFDRTAKPSFEHAHEPNWVRNRVPEIKANFDRPA